MVDLLPGLVIYSYPDLIIYVAIDLPTDLF